VGRGSARSIPEINLYDMLKKCEDLFSSFGGHDCAAGLNIAAENVPAFVERFTKIAEYTLTERHLLKSLKIDADTTLNQINFDVARELNRMEPFGHANPKPVFRATGVSIGGKPKPIGKKGNHLTFYIKQGNASMRAVAFGMAEHLEQLATRGLTFDIAFTPYINNFRGTDSLEVQILDLRPAESSVPAPAAPTL
jgi:single-stranded-DNA-specific exonuclease